MAASAPLESRLKTLTTAGPNSAFEAKSRLPAQLMSIPVMKPGPAPGNGDPRTAARAPLLEMLNMATLPNGPLNGSATERNLPFGDILTPSSVAPAAKGEPGIGDSDPSAAIAKAEIVPEPAFPQNRNLKSGVTANEYSPPPPAGKGDPGTAVSNPVVGSMEKPLRFPLPVLPA